MEIVLSFLEFFLLKKKSFSFTSDCVAMDFLPNFHDSDDENVDAPPQATNDDTLESENVEVINIESGNEREGDNEASNSRHDDIQTPDDNDDDINDDDDEEEEELNTNVDVVVPPLSHWKEHGFFERYTVTVAKGKRFMWDQTKKEVLMIKRNISELRLPEDMAGMAASELYKVYQTLFGSSSLLCATFQRYLTMKKVDYLHFMLTYVLSCKNQQSAATLHSSMEINSKILMPLEKYTAFWSKIRDMESSRRQAEFWKLVEDAVNRQLRLLFVSSESTFPYHIGFDDDKVHFDFSSKTNMQGLSPQVHQKDNRRGLTLHTCAYSATCVPVTVSFQRSGESVQDTYYRSMQDVFGTGSGGLPCLRGVTLASDRGYWEKTILFGQMLEAGADVIGTVKRVSFFLSCILVVSFFSHHC